MWGPDPYYQQQSKPKDTHRSQKPTNEGTFITGQPEEVEDEDDDIGPEETGELALSAIEIREKRDGSLAIGFGTGDAWELLSLTGSFFYNRDWHFGGRMGGGPWRFTGDRDSRRYEINAVSRVTGLHARYFFTDMTPFYLQTGLGFSFFTGDVKPVGGDGVEESSQEEANISLRSGFRSTAFYLSQQLGWQTNWESGFLIEFSIVGLSRTWFVQREFTKSADAAKSAVNSEMEGYQSWGLLNVRLGWLF